MLSNIVFLLPTLLLLLLPLVCGQMCSEDEDCNEGNPCCSGFGFCGSGEGFCTPSTRVGPAGRPPVERFDPPPPRRSGSGCSLGSAEIVGGDLPVARGGGGINVDNDVPEECFNRCEENPGCSWFTFDSRQDLCYLKSDRGYIRNRTDGFTSGATFRDGCNLDPACLSPYSFYQDQCMFFSSRYQPWDVSLADARRNLNQTRQLCSQYGGFLPYSYSGYQGRSSRWGDDWHWVNYGGSGEKCWACRPSRWGEGLRSFPCQDSLRFACQRERAFRLPIPPRPAACTSCLDRPIASRPTGTLDNLNPGSLVQDLELQLLKKQLLRSRQRELRQREARRRELRLRELRQRELRQRNYLRRQYGLRRFGSVAPHQRLLPNHRFLI